MPTIKPSVSLSEFSQELLGPYTKSERNPIGLSPAINMILERYDWIVGNSLPALNQDEWQLLLNIYSGSELSSYNPPYRIASDMMDSLGIIEVGEAPDQYQALIKKCYVMTQAQQLAILDKCQRFWSSKPKEDEPFMAFIERL